MSAPRPLITALLVAGLLLAGTGRARAQLMDGQWFKLKVSSKGYSVDAANGDALVKSSFKTTVYMQLVFATDHYDFSIWTETAPGLWAETFTDAFFPLLGANESLLSDAFFSIDHQDGGFLEGFLTGRFIIKKDAQGGFVSATFKSLGGEAVDFSTLDGVDDYRGGLKISGKTVPGSLLPFTPL